MSKRLRTAVTTAAVSAALVASACEPAPTKPMASVSDAVVQEGNSGNATLSFTVTLSKPSTELVRLAWITTDGSAVQPGDYAVGSGSLEFAPGATLATVDVSVAGDNVDEPDETMNVVLFPSVYADVADATGVGTIRDDDAAPQVSIDDAPAGAETNTGSWAGFPVRLSHPASRAVKVSCRTVDGTAKAGKDFPVQNPCEITVPAGQTRADLHIPRTDDNVDEDDESYSVQLVSADGGVIADGTAATTIFDNDAAPTFVIDDVDIAEGNPGDQVFAFFHARLSHPSSRTITVNCEASSGTAKENDDFVDTGGQCFSFPFERTTDDTHVAIWEDTKKEDDETFFVDITGVTAGSGPVVLADRQARGILRNDGDTCILFCS